MEEKSLHVDNLEEGGRHGYTINPETIFHNIEKISKEALDDLKESIRQYDVGFLIIGAGKYVCVINLTPVHKFMDIYDLNNDRELAESKMVNIKTREHREKFIRCFNVIALQSKERANEFYITRRKLS